MVQLYEMISRDAHQSMFSTSTRTEDMLLIAEKVASGYYDDKQITTTIIT